MPAASRPRASPSPSISPGEPAPSSAAEPSSGAPSAAAPSGTRAVVFMPCRKGAKSRGSGNSVVELFSAAISAAVCKKRNCSEAGWVLRSAAALVSFSAAWNSPSALITLALRSLSASACRAIMRFISWGRSTSFTSTAVTSIPHTSVPSSMISRRISLNFFRSPSNSSNSACPITERNVVCASCEVANRKSSISRTALSALATRK